VIALAVELNAWRAFTQSSTTDDEAAELVARLAACVAAPSTRG